MLRCMVIAAMQPNQNTIATNLFNTMGRDVVIWRIAIPTGVLQFTFYFFRGKTSLWKKDQKGKEGKKKKKKREKGK